MRIGKFAIIVSAVSLSAFIGQAFAADMPAHELKAARTELKAGKVKAAFEKVERAETALLNNQQSGNTPQGLDQVKKAHDDLLAKDRNGAMSEIDSALSAMNAS